MKKYDIKVSFSPLFAECGTVYRKRFSIPSEVFIAFQDACQAESALTEDIYRKGWLEKSLIIKRSKDGSSPYVLMNVTQTQYFRDWAIRNEQIIIDNKRASYEANGWLCII